MPSLKLKLILALFLSLAVLHFIASPAKAAMTINSATLNGGSSVSVAPSASVTANVNVTISASSNWQSTSYTVNGSTTCVDTANHTSAGTYSESFGITAPASSGTYDVSFTAYANNTCGGGSSSAYNLTGGITVTNPTPTPTSAPGPTPTPGPGATSTPSSSSGSGSSSSSSTTYFPTITISSGPSGATTNLVPSFSGTAYVDNGTITSVEYSLDNGSNWIPVSPSDGKYDSGSENFAFTTKRLSPGDYTLLIRGLSLAGVYTQSSSYGSRTFSVKPAPPSVSLDEISSTPTQNATPTISGSATSEFLTIEKTEISLDGGNSWTPVTLSGGRFSFTPQPLEDGNYDIVARAIDTDGNIGTSQTQTLIVDNLPPILGGVNLSLGPQNLIPEEDGTLSVVSGADITFTVSTKGGVTKLTVKAGGMTYDLSHKSGSSIWSGLVGFSATGSQDFVLIAEDGAGNRIEKSLGKIVIIPSGKITDKGNGESIEGAKVSLYYYDTSTKSWVLWDAPTYGQVNPRVTSTRGIYSFMVPAGRYYIEVSAPGFYKAQSQILTVDKLSAVNADFALRPTPKFTITLPVIGKLTLIIPNFFPPDENIVNLNETTAEAIASPLIGKSAPSLILSNTHGETIDIRNTRGQKVVLSFIANWSPQSIEQAAILSEFAEGKPANTTVLAVGLQQNSSVAQTFMNAGDYKFTLLADKNGTSADSYNVAFLPTTYFIDSQNIVRDIHVGLLSKEEIVAKLSNMQ